MTKKKLLFFGAAFLLLLGGLYGGGNYFFPLERAALSNKMELWKGRVSEVEVHGIHGYRTESTCPQKTSAGAGECTCVALIHGLGDEAMTWKKILLYPQTSWRELGLTGPMQFFAWDLPGHGKTSPPHDLQEYRVRRLANAIRPALASLCKQWVVVGNSLGGAVATWLALDWPEGVSRLILLSSAGLKKDRESPLKFFENPTVQSLKEFQRKAYFRPRPIPDVIWEQIIMKIQRSSLVEVRKAQISEDDLDLRFPALKLPVLVLWGKEDQVLPLTQGRQILNLIPGAVWREISECGHLPQKECPLSVIQSIVDMIRFGAV